MSEKIYVKGMRSFPKNEKAPDFVIGTLVITPNDLIKFIKENEQYLTDYNGEKQIKIQMLKSDKGATFVLDTYKKVEKDLF
jgi:hypothetical protein